MVRKLLPVAAMLSLVLLLPAPARAQSLDPPLLWVNSGCGNACPLLFMGGTEVTSIPTSNLFVFLNGGAKQSVLSPILLIVGIPNDPGMASAPGIASLSSGTGQLGGTHIYGGSWNTSTGFAGSFTTGKVYSLIGLTPPGSPSQDITPPNWIPAELAITGINATSFGLYVYRLNTTLTGGCGSGPFTACEVHVNFSGNLPVGTFAIAYACDNLNTAGTNCKNQGHVFATPFTQSGVVTQVPEPGTMALFGSGLLGLAAVVRRRLRL